MECTIDKDGEIRPIKMTDKILPVEGSVKPATSGGGTGTCPRCLTPGVLLSIVGGYVRKHTVSAKELPENNPQPATPMTERREHKHAGHKITTGLSEPQVDLTDTGLRTGDPREAGQRRRVEIVGAAGTGTVKVPRKVEGNTRTKSGKPRMVTKLVDVPNTEENVREALDYWRKRNPRSDASRKAQNANVSALVRQLESIMAAQAVTYNHATRSLNVASVPVAEQPRFSASTDTAQGHRGPTLVPGRPTIPRTRPEDKPWDEHTDLRRDGSPRKMTTLDQPRGRDRFDRMITDVPEPAPAPKLSRAAQRRARRARHERQIAGGNTVQK